MTQRSLRPGGSILLILLLGAWLRFHALAQDARFHPDEALFATFARNAAVQGDWLLRGPLDKTPLTIYINALALTFFGVTTLPDGVLTLDVQRGEFAARVPGVFASTLLMAVMVALAKRAFAGRRTRHASSLQTRQTRGFVLILTALSPFALAFSATAFTDGLMLLCVTLALWMGSRGRWLWAGIWLALGFGCKQQALFYAPLVLGVGWVLNSQTSQSPQFTRGGVSALVTSLLRFFAPVVIGILLLMVWDAARGQETSLWALALANNEPGRLELAGDFVPRLSDWLGYAQYFVGYGWLTGILTLLALAVLIMRHFRERQSVMRRIDIVLAVYTAAYLLLHGLAFNLYDRYLLLILPPVVLLLARGIAYLTQRRKVAKTQRKNSPLASLLLCVSALIVFPAALAATTGQLPVGGDQGEHTGMDELGAYLNNKPLGTIIYDHWLGWELDYYIGTWSDKRRVYYPTPTALVADALLQPDPAPRYMVVPEWGDGSAWLGALEVVGFEVALDWEKSRFRVYKLLPPPR